MSQAASEQPAIQPFAWRIGGPQGSGIDRLATVFGQACAGYGLHIFAHREYHSNIIGRHSYSDLAVSPSPLSCHRESPEIVVSFEAESLCRHAVAIANGGTLIYAADDAAVALDSLPYLDARFRADLPATTAELLEQARLRDVQLVAMPYTELLTDIAAELELPRRQAARALNTLAVAASAALLGMSAEALTAVLAETFGQNPEVVRLNALAVRHAYTFIYEHYAALIAPAWPSPSAPEAERLFVNGSQGVALGKLAAGLGFQTYYPISPASDESLFLEGQEPLPLRNGGCAAPIILQVEDEIAAASMACGAALTGARSATSTSGPGFCHMTESLGWAGMNEVPLVVSLYQRGGPATGLPTRTEQGDLQFAIHAGHGEFPRVVIASGDVEDCFYDAMRAFNLAERYQLPVIHLLDKTLASTSQTVPRFAYNDLPIDRGERLPADAANTAPVERFAITESGISPRPLLGEHDSHHWLTGAEHNSQGHVSEDPLVREQMLEKRARKLEQLLRDLSRDDKLRVFGDNDAALTVVTWGSTTGAIRDAVQRLGESGRQVRAIQLRLLWPFPAEELSALLAAAAPLVVAECNHSGQLNQLLKEQLGRGADHLLLKYSGRPMTGDAVLLALESILAGAGEPRQVLSNPNE